MERKDMEQAMYLILLQDQQIKLGSYLKQQADTSLVYEGIFQSLGYTTDDFLYSMEYYLEEPARFEKVMESVANRLEKEEAQAQIQMDLSNWRDGMLRIYWLTPDTLSMPQPGPRAIDSLLLRFQGDSLYLVREDTFPYYPKDTLLFLRDSLSFKRDSLSFKRDSLSVKRDSLRFYPKDSLTFVKDSR